MGITDNNRHSHGDKCAASLNVNLLKLVVSTVLLGALPISGASAGDWKLIPNLKLGETYTDNVTLAPRGSEKGDLITEISPGFVVTGDSRRLKMRADYRLQNLIFLQDPSRDHSYNQLNAVAKAELVNDSVFMDANMTAGQALINSSRSIALNNFSGNNRANFYTYRLSPYYRHAFGGYGTALLRYSNYGTYYSSGGASDANGNRVDADLRSGPHFGRLSWGLNYYNDRLKRQNYGDYNNEAGVMNARYGVTSSWSLLAQAGYEQHNFPTSTPRAFRNGNYLAAGVGWRANDTIAVDTLYGSKYKSANVSIQPTSRTKLNVGYVDSSVGLNTGGRWHGSFSLRTRHSNWTAGYVEDTVVVQQVAGLPITYSDPVTGASIVNPQPGDLVRVEPYGISTRVPAGGVNQLQSALATVAGVPVNLTNEPYQRKRGQIGYAFNTGRTSAIVLVYDERREFLVSLVKQQVSGVSANLNWRFASRTSYLIDGSLNRIRYLATDRQDTFWYVGTGFQRRLSRNASATLMYRHTQRNSNQSGADYTENRLTLSVYMHF